MEKLTNATQVANALQNKGAVAFAPNGNSMWPFIKNHKQTVIVERVEEPVELYDVVLFVRKDGSLVLHRVIGLSEKMLTVCGDSLLSLERIRKDRVIGVMTGFYKGKKIVPSRQIKYLKKVKNWYKRKKLRKFKIKCFYTLQKICVKIKRLDKENV